MNTSDYGLSEEGGVEVELEDFLFFLLRASAGFSVPFGISHTRFTLIAPWTRFSLQRRCTHLSDTSHFSAVSCAVIYSNISDLLKCYWRCVHYSRLNELYQVCKAWAIWIDNRISLLYIAERIFFVKASRLFTLYVQLHLKYSVAPPQLHFPFVFLWCSRAEQSSNRDILIHSGVKIGGAKVAYTQTSIHHRKKEVAETWI